MNLSKLNVKLRIAVVQLNPQIGCLDETISRAKHLISIIKPHPPDIVVFPEFALSGYSFHSSKHIEPYLYQVTEGPAYELSRHISKQLKCYTIMGYPEKVVSPNDRSINDKCFNSAIVVDSSGEIAFNYRKSFLYHTDENWQCLENPAGFQTFELPFKKKGRDLQTGEMHDVKLKTSIGICMDLSPYKFEAPFHDMEFSSFQVENDSELIVCPMAWLHSSSVTNQDEDSKQKKERLTKALKEQGLPSCGSQGKYQIDIEGADTATEIPACKPLESEQDHRLQMRDTNYEELDQPDVSNVNYWLLRFLPFLACKLRKSWFSERLLVPVIQKFKSGRTSYLGASTDKSWLFEKKEAILVLANRCGVEDGITAFAGSSGIYKFNGKYGDQEESLDLSNKSVSLLGNLSKGYEGVLVRNVDFQVRRPKPQFMK
ncbi:LAMI_0G03246g1_1 [Lachancea mirantina]|uniref:LAMI_0G03246g1_1 n=1 Tax=Lachancea mirantina TaxID=1230905 RepID=A0A1G4K898_9SACH|nr:LAMI_0G03246g1_1 [Lachancea mirantina]